MLLFSYLLSFAHQFWADSLLSILNIGQLSVDPACLPITIRSARPDDIDDIANTIIHAFDPSPLWKYMYQFKDEFPAYHQECIGQEIRKVLETERKEYDLIANVIDAPVGTTAGSKSPKAIAIAIWVLVKKGNPLIALANCNCQDRLDANVTRIDDFNRQFALAQHRYLQSPYNDQLHLVWLATHPDWQGQGFAPAHCRWGQDYARMKSVNITLLATPEGYPVYRDVEFESLENITIHRVDGNDTFWYDAMMWDPDMSELGKK